MEITHHLVSPSYHRNPDFKSAELEEDYTWECRNCGSSIALTFEQASKSYWQEGLKLSKEEFANLKSIYGIGYVGKSHDGGWPHFTEIQCHQCNERYMVYLGIKEPVNSCLHITVQAISVWR